MTADPPTAARNGFARRGAASVFLADMAKDAGQWLNRFFRSRGVPMVKKGYESEFSIFINTYLSEHPEILDDQRRGREIFWDKRVDLQAEREADADSVPAEQYYYYGWPDAKA